MEVKPHAKTRTLADNIIANLAKMTQHKPLSKDDFLERFFLVREVMVDSIVNDTDDDTVSIFKEDLLYKLYEKERLELYAEGIYSREYKEICAALPAPKDNDPSKL